mgnify:CR=1 FL=1
MRRKLLKIGLGVFAALPMLAGVGWLVFVPAAKEPGYEFVTAWGEQGTSAVTLSGLLSGRDHHPRIPKKRLMERRNVGVVDIRIALCVNPFRVALG